MKNLQYILGGGKGNSLSVNKLHLYSLISAIQIVLMLGFSLSACEKADYGESEEAGDTRTQENKSDSTSVNTEESGFDVNVSDEDWEVVDGGNY